MKTVNLEHTAQLQAAEWVGKCLFQVVHVVLAPSRQVGWSASSGQLGLSESVSQQTLLLIDTLRKRESVNLASFLDFLKLLSSSLPELKEIPCRMNFFIFYFFTYLRPSCFLTSSPPK